MTTMPFDSQLLDLVQANKLSIQEALRLRSLARDPASFDSQSNKINTQSVAPPSVNIESSQTRIESKTRVGLVEATREQLTEIWPGQNATPSIGNIKKSLRLRFGQKMSCTAIRQDLENKGEMVCVNPESVSLARCYKWVTYNNPPSSVSLPELHKESNLDSSIDKTGMSIKSWLKALYPNEERVFNGYKVRMSPSRCRLKRLRKNNTHNQLYERGFYNALIINPVGKQIQTFRGAHSLDKAIEWMRSHC